jgi:hypothetical protein
MIAGGRAVLLEWRTSVVDHDEEARAPSSCTGTGFVVGCHASFFYHVRCRHSRPSGRDLPGKVPDFWTINAARGARQVPSRAEDRHRRLRGGDGSPERRMRVGDARRSRFRHVLGRITGTELSGADGFRGDRQRRARRRSVTCRAGRPLRRPVG